MRLETTPIEELKIAPPMLLEAPPQYVPIVTVEAWQGALAVIVV